MAAVVAAMASIVDALVSERVVVVAVPIVAVVVYEGGNADNSVVIVLVPVATITVVVAVAAIAVVVVVGLVVVGFVLDPAVIGVVTETAPTLVVRLCILGTKADVQGLPCARHHADLSGDQDIQQLPLPTEQSNGCDLLDT